MTLSFSFAVFTFAFVISVMAFSDQTCRTPIFAQFRKLFWSGTHTCDHSVHSAQHVRMRFLSNWIIQNWSVQHSTVNIVYAVVRRHWRRFSIRTHTKCKYSHGTNAAISFNFFELFHFFVDFMSFVNQFLSQFSHHFQSFRMVWMIKPELVTDFLADIFLCHNCQDVRQRKKQWHNERKRDVDHRMYE